MGLVKIIEERAVLSKEDKSVVATKIVETPVYVNDESSQIKLALSNQGPQGVPGPQGPTGADGVDGTNDAYFVFNQITPTDEWSITHNLNKNPSVTVVDSAGSIVVGEVEYVNLNQIVVRFTTTFAGKAYLN